jgi:general secretion pathway protein I
VRTPRGFTLIEVLVALVVVALGMSALMETLGSAADTATWLRDKTFAEWIGFNQLATLRLSGSLPSEGTTDGELDYAGRHWRWHQEVNDGELPGILRIDVTVQEADTPQGKDAPWIGSASAAIGDAVAQAQSTSLYLEYAQLPGAGTPNGGALEPNGSIAPNGSTVEPNGGANSPVASPPPTPFGER